MIIKNNYMHLTYLTIFFIPNLIFSSEKIKEFKFTGLFTDESGSNKIKHVATIDKYNSKLINISLWDESDPEKPEFIGINTYDMSDKEKPKFIKSQVMENGRNLLRSIDAKEGSMVITTKDLDSDKTIEITRFDTSDPKKWILISKTSYETSDKENPKITTSNVPQTVQNEMSYELLSSSSEKK